MAPRPVGVGSPAPQSVFQSANGVLHFALELISFAFAFELAVAGYLSDNFLHFALGLLSRAVCRFLLYSGIEPGLSRARACPAAVFFASSLSAWTVEPYVHRQYAQINQGGNSGGA